MIAFILLLYVFVIMILVTENTPQGYKLDNNKKSTEGDIAGTSATGQIYEAEVNVEKSVDARPRKISSPIRSKTTLPWKQ